MAFHALSMPYPWLYAMDIGWIFHVYTIVIGKRRLGVTRRRLGLVGRRYPVSWGEHRRRFGLDITEVHQQSPEK